MNFKRNKIAIQKESAELTLKDENSYYKYVFGVSIVYMKVLGLFHFKSDHVALKCYRLFAILCCRVCFAKFLTSFQFFYGTSESFNKNLVIKICMALWLLVNSIHITLSFPIMEIETYKNDFLRKLHELLKQDDNLEQDLKSLRRKFFFIFLISFLLFISQMATVFLSYFGPKDLENLFGVALAPYSTNSTVGSNAFYRLSETGLMIYPGAVWTTFIFSLFAELLVVERLLKNFNKKLEQFIQTANAEVTQDLEKFEENFEKLRQDHLRHCDLISSLNKCYKLIISTFLIFYQASNLLVLYVMSNWTNNCITGILAFAYPFWLSTNTFIIAVTLYSSSQISVLVAFFFIFKQMFM